MIFNTKWNFFADPAFAISNYPSGTVYIASGAQTQCLTYTYAYPSDTDFPNRYGFYCPLAVDLSSDPTQKLQITNF